MTDGTASPLGALMNHEHEQRLAEANLQRERDAAAFVWQSQARTVTIPMDPGTLKVAVVALVAGFAFAVTGFCGIAALLWHGSP